MRSMALERLVCFAGAVALAGLTLGCGIFPTSTQKLIQTAMTDPSPQERGEALAALKGRTQPGMRQDLEAILARELDPASRALAADLLGEIGDPASVPELRASARTDTRGVVRERALEALGKVLGPDALDDIQYALRNDPEPDVRAGAAALALQCLRPEDARSLLLEALGDRAAVVRLQASAMLAKLTGLNVAPDAESWRKALQAPKP
jgi:HEAT repeat protein